MLSFHTRRRGASGSEYGLGVGLVGAAALAALLAAGGSIEDLLDGSSNAIGGLTNETTESAPVADGADITGVVMPDGVYSAGDTLRFEVTWDESVTVGGGTPSIPVVIGTTEVAVPLVSGGGTATHAYEAPVPDGLVDSDGLELAAGGIRLDGAVLEAADGSQDVETALSGDPSGATVSAPGPMVAAVDAPTDGTYAEDDRLIFRVQLDEAVDITDTPGLNYDIGGTIRTATYVGTYSGWHQFYYDVQTGDNDTDGVALAGWDFTNGEIRSTDGRLATDGPTGTYPGVQVLTLEPTKVAGPAGGHYGREIAYDGGLAAVCANAVNTTFILDPDTGENVRSLTGLDANDVYGCDNRMAADGNTLAQVAIINDINGDADRFEIRFYDMTTGMESSTMSRITEINEEPLGSVVSIDLEGDRLALGFSGEAIGTGGRVYVVSVSSGELLHELQSDYPYQYAQFGISVDIDGDKIAVGEARGRSYNDVWNIWRDDGKAHIFDLSDGSRDLTIEPSSIEWRWFGRDVDLEGSDLLVMAPGTRQDDTGSVGAAFTYDATTGVLKQEYQMRMRHPDYESDAQMGSDGAFMGNYVVLAADEDRHPKGYVGTGSLFIFDRETGEQILNEWPDDIGAGDHFTYGFAAEGDRILGGAMYHDVDGVSNSGAVYIYDLPGILAP